jgi:hypothetical protein
MTGATLLKGDTRMRSRLVQYAALIGLGIAALASPAAAEMEVIESNSPRYTVGMRLADNAILRLNAGERVRVLLHPSMRTKVFTGSSQAGKGPPGGTRTIKP